MPLDPDALKARWGITDSSKDALIGQVAGEAQALAEAYTGRYFDLAADEADFQPVNYSFQVQRYPIKQITALHGWLVGQLPADPDPGAPIVAYRLDRAKGLVWPSQAYGFGMVHCAWEGGFETWPPDLNWAITQAADIVWGDTPGGGAPVGSAGGAALGTLKKLSVVGVYTAEIADADAGAADGDNSWGILPPAVTAVLDRYRVAAVVGIG